MLIDTIRLQHFRCHLDTELRFAPLTFIVGRNGTGKSSIVDALEWALTGACRGTDSRGAGSKLLIGEGADHATVTLGLNGQALVRSVTAAGASQVHPAPPVGNREAIHILLNGTAFLDFEHAEAKKLLLDLLDVRVPIGDERLTLAEIEARYQQAYEERRQAKATAQAIRVPERPAEAPPDVPALEAKLNTLRLQEKALIAGQATAVGRRTELQRERDRLRQELAELPAEMPPDLAESIVALEERLAIQTDGEPATLTEDLLVDSPTLRISEISALLEQLNQHEPTRGCVLERAIPCKTPAKHFTVYMATLERQLADFGAARVQAEAAAAQRKQALEDFWRAKADRVGDEERLANLKLRQGHAQAVAERRAQLRIRVTAVERELADFGASSSAELETLQDRIGRGEVVIKRARELARQADEHQAASAQKTTALARVTELEQFVEQLGPKGARVQALAAALGAFEARINAVLGRWGYRLAIQPEAWQVLVNGRPATLLSTSERLRLGVALSFAVADVTGTPFVAIDQADLLDTTNRGMLTELVRAWEGQVLIVGTKDEEWDPPLVDGIVTYRLTRDGQKATATACYDVQQGVTS